MHYYILDPKQYDGKNFELHQSRLLSLLAEYHVTGETARTTTLRTVEDLVATALSHSVTTLVVVGGDETFSRVMSACHGKQVTLGYIPINSHSETARVLGIRNIDDAVATIAKRRVEVLDVARAGKTHFISHVYFGPAATEPVAEEHTSFMSGMKKMFTARGEDIQITVDGKYHIGGRFLGGSVVNVRDNSLYPDDKPCPVGNPIDGWLDVVLAGKLTGLQAWRYRQQIASRCFELVPGGSVVHAKKVSIVGPEGMPIYLSGEIIARAPVDIEMTEEKLRVVVGRNRQF